MYDLKRVTDSKWSIAKENHEPFLGSLKDVCQVATIAFKFKLEEIEIAVDELAWMDHDVAHFGIERRFIYTYDTNKGSV